MAPSRSLSSRSKSPQSQMHNKTVPKTRSSISASNTPQTTLKQGTLGFAVKRSSSGVVKNGKGKLIIHGSDAPVVRKLKAKEEQESSVDETESTAGTEGENSLGVFKVREGVENVEDLKLGEMGTTNETKEHRQLLDLRDNDGRWTKHYGAVRGKMGYLKPIHGTGQTKIHEILRVFDLSYEYGPCIGVTRLERWERAKALGLNPPLEVREILMTKQGSEQDEFKQCVFHDQV